MTRRLIPQPLALKCCAVLGVSILFARSDVPILAQAQAPATTDQKLDEVLKRLTRIEQRLGTLEKSARPGGRVANLQPQLAVAPTLAAHNIVTRRPGVMPASGVPAVADKPPPHVVTFNGCEPKGDAGNGHGDPDLNFLKNRDDQADNWIKVDFDAVLTLPFPEAVGKHDRTTWTPEDRAAVQKFEGLPISVVCFFGWAKDEKEESCNCHQHDKSMFDIHTWLLKEPAEIDGSQAPDRSQAVVAEVTPRLKAEHPKWTQNLIRQLARDGKQVRLSGWLLLDQEHPEQITGTASQDPTRATLWEIHPIMEIEVLQNGKWVPLDDQ
jgi:hypothetical protein